jgi:hypothetical protein
LRSAPPRSFVRKAGPAEADIYRLLATAVRELGAELCQRVDFRFEFDPLGSERLSLLQFALAAERSREPVRNSPPPRICGACSSEKVDCLIDIPQRQMARSQCLTIIGHSHRKSSARSLTRCSNCCDVSGGERSIAFAIALWSRGFRSTIISTGPEPPIPADLKRDADQERLVRAFPVAGEPIECTKSPTAKTETVK